MRLCSMSKSDSPNLKSVDAVQAMDAAQAAIDQLAVERDHAERLATLGLLAAGVAHEINNILTPVLAYAQMAAAKPDDAELQAKAIEKTVLGVETATRIASGILSFAGDDDAAEAEVSEVVQNALNCIARNPNKDRIELRLEIQRGLVVQMNPLHLQQVLMNLIINAQQAMREHGRPSRLTIAAITRADGTIGIRVADNGPGIPREIAGRIFEPFVTGRRNSDKTTGERVGGSGLGLSICRRLVEKAGGTITASSTQGQGTTFLIVLPRPMQARAKAI